VAHDFDLDLVKRVIRMVERSEYKRQQAAPGIKSHQGVWLRAQVADCGKSEYEGRGSSVITR